MLHGSRQRLIWGLAGLILLGAAAPVRPEEPGVRRLLYVTSPDGAGGTRNPPGLYVYDIDDGHKRVKYIAIPDMGGTRGCCGSARTGRLFISHRNTHLMCFDLIAEKKVWEVAYPKEQGGADRCCVTPDGKKVYVPEGWWTNRTQSLRVVDGATGKTLKMIPLGVGNGHNSIMSPTGKRMYLGSTTHGKVFVIDTATDRVIKHFGPFGRDPSGAKGRVSPYCINGAETRCFVNSHHVGFYVGDLVRETVPHWVQVEKAAGFSHGVGMTPDEKEIWLPNPNDKRLWVFDATVMPPRRLRSIGVSRKSHGWITFSLDGAYAWPDTSDVFDARSKRVVATLKDEAGKPVASSKFIEVHWRDGKVVRMGDQFGIGRTGTPYYLK